MKILNNKVALVTGSSRGIGAEIVQQFGKSGAKVVINYNGSKEKAEEVVHAIITKGGEAIAVQADVSKPEDVARLFDATIAHFGKIDILVNNAGLMLNSSIKDAADDLFEKQMNVNVKGVFNTLREASTKLADHGSIINFSSTVTRTIFPTYGIYSATKAAVEQISKVFAKEIGSRGINVNCVLPGPTSTELFLKGKPDEVIAKLAGTNAFNRLGTPEDIAKIVVFLASDESKWISAQSIGANGGMA
ncbi:SDR family oxidoreductase [Cellulophaga baltica]|uniref:SDR family oxidoreductase n=1 Tax=Cellulophaga TaxID=104264 RepID=UPI001C069395|nr:MULTISPECIES: SDR family oxidoreductase [Cellulophaga]MBU2998112.1 SDR family oxidoreductase [Cellulophaga baltica]MDO6769516.1 SDR family oxidoreductase [Cellulophaga sp. 1_MG-2023]